jgi:hypothetical protein
MRTLTGSTVLSFFSLFSVALPLAEAQANERKPPKRPDRPFTIWVHAEPRGEPEIEEKILRAKDVFEESIERRDDWFLRVEDRHDAEMVVELKALFVENENRSDSRTSVMGPLSHTSDYLVAGSRYHFYAVATLFGSAVEFTGSGERKEKDAASTLVGELDRYVKKNYWQLVERRQIWHASHVPAEDLGREWIGQEITRRVEALGARVGSVAWTNQTLVVAMDANEFQFPFPPDGFDECVRTVECQRLMVKQIMDHLEQALGKQ